MPPLGSCTSRMPTASDWNKTTPAGSLSERVCDYAFAQSRWLTMLMTLPSGARTKNRRTPHASVVSGCTIS